MLEAYSSKRVSMKKETEDGRNHPRTNVISHYVSMLLNMLQQQVRHHSFTTATATMETVAMAMDQVPDVMRTLGVTVLSHGQDDATYRAKLQMLKHLYARHPKHRTCLLMETSLFIASHGNLRESYDTLQSQIHLEPFKSHYLVHGCSAVLQYLMWRKEVWSVGVATEVPKEGVWSGDEATELPNEGVRSGGVAPELLQGEECSEKIKALSKQAMHHFRVLEDLHPSPSLNMDMFINIHSKLLVSLGRGEEALQLLTSYRDMAPGRVTACRLVCAHVRSHCARSDLVPHLHMLAVVDESSPEALELATIMCEGEEEYERIFEMVVKFLDYPHNRSNTLAWQLLDKMQSLWPDYEHGDLWTKRMSWWQDHVTSR